jgi:hypothetical protein
MVEGRWKLSFPGLEVSQDLQKPDHLYSWTDRPETRNFSGKCRYVLDFNVPSSYIEDGHQLELDLGKVGNVAEVWMNDQHVGTIWMRGQKLDITDVVNEGINTIEIGVTNTLINRVSAMTEHQPIEPGLLERFGGSAVDPDRLPREFGFEPLPMSGLLGPVMIRVLKEVLISTD